MRQSRVREAQIIGFEGVVRGKEPKATIPDNALPCPLEKVNRHFYADLERSGVAA